MLKLMIEMSYSKQLLDFIIIPSLCAKILYYIWIACDIPYL